MQALFHFSEAYECQKDNISFFQHLNLYQSPCTQLLPSVCVIYDSSCFTVLCKWKREGWGEKEKDDIKEEVVWGLKKGRKNKTVGKTADIFLGVAWQGPKPHQCLRQRAWSCWFHCTALHPQSRHSGGQRQAWHCASTLKQGHLTRVSHSFRAPRLKACSCIKAAPAKNIARLPI